MLSGGTWLSVLIVPKAPFAAEHALRFHRRPVCQTRCLGFRPCAAASVDFDAGTKKVSVSTDGTAHSDDSLAILGKTGLNQPDGIAPRAVVSAGAKKVCMI